MKKLFTTVLAIMMIFVLALSTTAAQFVSSITNKGAPQLIVLDDTDGKDVVGFITDKDGNKITIEVLDCFIIHSLKGILDNKDDIAQDIKDETNAAYDAIKGDDNKITDICPELDEIVKEKWGEDKSANDLVIKDLFYLEENCNDIREHLSEDGTSIELTFDVGIAGDTFITAMVYVDGKWQPVLDTINNGDGTVTVKFSEICPVAFLVPGSGENVGVSSPATVDTSSVVLWSSVMAVSLVAIVALVIFRRKVNG